MDRKFFLGIADNGRFASVVLGDLSGRIIATNHGGSVNYHYWGMERAQANLMALVRQTVSWEKHACLEGICLTYKAAQEVPEWPFCDVLSGFSRQTGVMVEDFATSSLLGMQGSNDRLFLVGCHSGLAILENGEGELVHLKQEACSWNPIIRINEKLQTVMDFGCRHDQAKLQYLKSQIGSGHCLKTLTEVLDYFVDRGSTLALELAYDVAFDLVQMVMSMSAHFMTRDPVIGLHGQVLLGSQTIRDRVYRLLSLLFPQCRVVDEPLAPAKGAYLSAVLHWRSRFAQDVITNGLPRQACIIGGV